jgi:hypothetical protein
MTTITQETVFDVVFENGLLRPLVNLPLEEHKHYRVSLQQEEPLSLRNEGPSVAPPDASRQREYAWLRAHRQNYAGQYVALLGDQLIAHGSDGRTVLEQARSAGFPRALMVRIEAEDELPFGGW